MLSERKWNVKQNKSFKNAFYPAFSVRLLVFNTVSTPPNLAAQPLVQYCVYRVYLIKFSHYRIKNEI